MHQKIKIPVAFSELLTPSRYKAYHSGRGAAKSHSGASAALIRGGERKLRIGCFREVQLSIKDSIKQLLDDKIAAYGLGGFYESLQNEIRGRNGTNFIFAGLGKMTTDQIKSMEGLDIALVEEAQTISARSLEVLIPTIRNAGSELWFFWNPRNANDPVDLRFRGETVPEDAIIRKVSYRDNPFFPKELRKEMEFDRKNNPERFGHIWEGEYEPMAVGAIWTRLVIHQGRRAEAPEMHRIVVSVDPAVSNTDNSDEHGITVEGLGVDQRGYVLDDVSMKGSPDQWATRVIAAYDKWSADAIVVERNQGGDMVKHTLDTVRPGLPIIEVVATRGKHIRAEPVASLYSFGKISHVGTFTKLEDQMCQMVAGGYDGDGSPDRVCSMVWGFTELFPNLIRQESKEEVYVEPMGADSWMS
ncbi:MAG: terminase [Nitrospinae bacterium]|nr:terminase [Nitrospinota bacterium]